MISKKSVLTGILTVGILGLLTGCGSDVSNVKGSVLPELSNDIKVGGHI